MAKQGFREKIVKKVIREQTNWVIGGYENSLLDKGIEIKGLRTLHCFKGGW
jgi:hypothetical protein